ncbi:MAG: hypothetical protein KIT68_13385, partial [Phycisphaeraceae bacterium]|nr:hypothetical protein [Phycisphaeraceae bacterium]
MAEPNESHARTPSAWRRVGGAALGVLEWIIAGACLIGGLCVVGSGAGWRVDLVANLAGHWGWALPPAVLWLAARRRWWKGVVAGVGLALVLSVWLSPRAERADPGGVPAERRVRVLHVNAGGMTPDATGLVAMIRSSGADIVAVTDCPTSLAREIWERRWVADLYPWCLRRPINANNPWQFVLSRWPLDDATAWGTDPAEARPLTATVHRPGGALVFLLLHPLSPRTGARWET